MQLPFNAHTTKWDADNALALACASNIAYTLDQRVAAQNVRSTFGFGNYHPVDTGSTQGFIAGDRFAVFLDGRDAAGAYAAMEPVFAPDDGCAPRLHHREDESFFAMAGEVTLSRGGEKIVLNQSEALFAPREIPHHFQNTCFKF
jgi:mannose-6-phosphate isomerase-like protein (cupin superfamily)